MGLTKSRIPVHLEGPWILAESDSGVRYRAHSERPGLLGALVLVLVAWAWCLFRAVSAMSSQQEMPLEGWLGVPIGLGVSIAFALALSHRLEIVFDAANDAIKITMQYAIFRGHESCSFDKAHWLLRKLTIPRVIYPAETDDDYHHQEPDITEEMLFLILPGHCVYFLEGSNIDVESLSRETGVRQEISEGGADIDFFTALEDRAHAGATARGRSALEIFQAAGVSLMSFLGALFFWGLGGFTWSELRPLRDAGELGIVAMFVVAGLGILVWDLRAHQKTSRVARLENELSL